MQPGDVRPDLRYVCNAVQPGDMRPDLRYMCHAVQPGDVCYVPNVRYSM